MTTKPFGMTALALAAMFALGSFAAPTASAQGKKIRSTVERRQHPGKGFWANERTSRNIQHARDYSRSIGRYTTQAPTINPVITQSESQMLGMQIQGIQRDMGIVRESYVDNPQVVEHVKIIDDKLAKASETQKMLHAECCKDTPDGKVCGEMATKLTTAMDEISNAHANWFRLCMSESTVDQRQLASMFQKNPVLAMTKHHEDWVRVRKAVQVQRLTQRRGTVH